MSAATMATISLRAHVSKSSLYFSQFLHHLSSSSFQTLENSLKTAIQTKSYHQIPTLLLSLSSNPKPPNPKPPNPFSFLSSFPPPLRTQIIDEILQSFLHLRPRSRLLPTYSHLLSFTFQTPDPLPLCLAILQRTLRSGCLPAPQTRFSLSSVWVRRRRKDSVSCILADMRAIGYRPDVGTCNYLIGSLCDVDELEEAVRVLREMGGGGGVADSESYGVVIKGLCRARKAERAKEMVVGMVREGLVPRQGTLLKVVAGMRANAEVREGVELVEWLEREGVRVGFEGYQVVVEGCLERKEFVLAGKVVVEMVERGFVPYIKVRQRVVEGLAGIGEGKLASFVRQKLAQVRS